jgi:hypothetical protein
MVESAHATHALQAAELEEEELDEAVLGVDLGGCETLLGLGFLAFCTASSAAM